ncbi:MAG TPA: isopentenyl-diphosphate Delta-isomerase [Micromonospora sp.]
MTSREHHLVELVDDHGAALGSATVDEAHRRPARLHRAFSVLLLDSAGRILLQQRSAAKTRFPLRWANACCGHPAPGQAPVEAANRRLGEEIGVGPLPLTELGVYLYYAEDPVTDRIEFEFDHVLRAELPDGTALLPDPDEVADLRWVHPEELLVDLDAAPGAYAPWLGGVLGRLLRASAGTGTPGAPAAPEQASAVRRDATAERPVGR